MVDGIMEQKQYKRILSRHLWKSADALFDPEEEYKCVFQQDNDPKHTAKSIQKYIANKEAQRGDFF